MTDGEIDGIVDCEDLAIEKLILRLKQFIEKKTERLEQETNAPQKQTKKEGFEKVKGNQVQFSPGDDLSEKEKLLKDLKATIAVLEAKVTKMENSVKAKNEKIRFLSKKLSSETDIQA